MLTANGAGLLVPYCWTDERVATLRQMWMDGASARLIASHLGLVTRSAVLGKVHRLGLPKRITRMGALRKKRITPKRGPASGAVKAIKKKRRKPALVVKDIVSKVTVPLHLSFNDLRSGVCRWPYGLNPYTYCGHYAEGSYCAGHKAEARRDDATQGPRPG